MEVEETDRYPNTDQNMALLYTLLLIIISLCLLLVYDQFSNRRVPDIDSKSEESEPNPEMSISGELEKAFIEKIRAKETGEELEKLANRINPNSETNCILYDNTITETKYSLLMFASHYDHLEALRLLIHRGAKPVWRNNFGATVLMMMAKRGQFEMANICLDAISSEKRKFLFVNLPNNKGWSPLMSSIENNHAKMANWLLQNGADPNATMEKTNWSSIHAAAKKGDQEMLGLLQRSGGDNAIEATHKLYGCNARPSDVYTSQRSIEEQYLQKKEDAEKLQLKSARERGLRAMIAMITITEFKGNQADNSEQRDDTWTKRKGAELDEVLKDTFREAFDCKVLSFDDPVKSKENYFKFLDKIKSEIKSANNDQKFELLMIVVSSHGATDSRGQFFIDYCKEKIYIDEDLKDQFSIDQFAEMEHMPASLIINACRDQLPEEKYFVDFLPRRRPRMPARCLTIQVTSEGHSALRVTNFGSLALQFLNRTIQQYKATLSLQDLVGTTQRDFLDSLEGKLRADDGRLQYQRFEITGNTLLQDVFFKAAK